MKLDMIVTDRTEKLDGTTKVDLALVEGDARKYGNYLVLESNGVPGVKDWMAGDRLTLVLLPNHPVQHVERTIEETKRPVHA